MKRLPSYVYLNNNTLKMCLKTHLFVDYLIHPGCVYFTIGPYAALNRTEDEHKY